MTPETIKLVRDAMKIWHRNGYAQHPSAFYVDPDKNPLCKKYLISSGSCVGCPVFEKTKQLACDGTAHHEAFIAKDAWTRKPYDQDLRLTAQSLALEMKAFLAALLPEEVA